MTKIEEIHQMIAELCEVLSAKVKSEEGRGLPPETVEFTQGQLYEAQYIRNRFWNIISK